MSEEKKQESQTVNAIDLGAELKSLIAEAAALDRALREQLRGILASIEAERARNARLIDMLEEMREWGEAKHAGLQHEIAHLRDQLRRVEGERDDLKRHYEEALECETESLRDQLRLISSLRAIARSPYTSADDLAADILAALGSSAARGARK